MLYVLFGDASLAAGGPLVDYWRSYMLALPLSIRDAAFQVIHRPSIVDELAAVRMPVLAIAGAEDYTYPQPISGTKIGRATNGREVTVPQVGHSVALERADAVAEILVAQLRDH